MDDFHSSGVLQVNTQEVSIPGFVGESLSVVQVKTSIEALMQMPVPSMVPTITLLRDAHIPTDL